MPKTRQQNQNSLYLSPVITIVIISILSPLSLAAQPSKFRRAPRFVGKLPHLTEPPQRQQRQQQQQYRYETRYFEQRLDHFSFADLPTFSQRYLINTDHWVGPNRLGPIFLYCGNEGDIEWFAVNSGFVWDIAPRFGAMLVFPEVCSFTNSNFYLFIFLTFKSSISSLSNNMQNENVELDFFLVITC